MIVGLKLNRNRGTKWQFVLSGFVRFFGKHYEEYNGNAQFKCNISDILTSSQQHVKDNPKESEQDYLAWILREISNKITHAIVEAFKDHYEQTDYSKRVLPKLGEIEKRAIAIMRQVFVLNSKDDTFRTIDEMALSRNTYEIVRQRPRNYFQYHMDVQWEPQRDLIASEERWFKRLHDEIKQDGILWFLDFVYRLRNALFHEIIDPLDEEWQMIFKSAYLVLKEIVDLNIQEIEQQLAAENKKQAAAVEYALKQRPKL